jgi:hypothetical protein
MAEEVEDVWLTVEDFKKEIKLVLDKGLRNFPSDKNRVRVKTLEDLFFNMKPKNWDQDIPVQIPPEISFEWLANETNWYQRKFDTQTVEKIHLKLASLNEKFLALDQLTIQINKRQKILGIEETQFKEQKRINEGLKPLHDLWGVCEEFRVNIIKWYEEPLEHVDYQVMENTVEEWQIELKRLQKCQIIGDNEKQSEALNFVLDCLVYLKKYHPLIKTMRVKGLTARHWRQINSELGLQIDPSTTCFLRLIGMEL